MTLSKSKTCTKRTYAYGLENLCNQPYAPLITAPSATLPTVLITIIIIVIIPFFHSLRNSASTLPIFFFISSSLHSLLLPSLLAHTLSLCLGCVHELSNAFLTAYYYHYYYHLYIIIITTNSCTGIS